MSSFSCPAPPSTDMGRGLFIKACWKSLEMAKRPGGRPTKYKPEYCEALVAFFDIEPYTKETVESLKEYYKEGGLKKELEKFKVMPNKMPTLYRFSKHIGVDYSTVFRWAQAGEDDPNMAAFRNAYKEAKQLQKEFLINIGLAGAAPAPFAIFTAKNVTDMRDKQEVSVSGLDGIAQRIKDSRGSDSA